MKDLEIELTNEEILALAKELQAKQKAEKEQKEQERKEQVLELMDIISELEPDSVESYEKELIKKSRHTDYKEYFVLVVKSFENACYYDGKHITTIKQDGSISKKSLPFKVFVSRFKLNWLNYFKGSNVLPESTDGRYSAKRLYEIRELNKVQEYKAKGSSNNDVNNATIHKISLQRKGLIARNKQNKK